MLELDDDLVRRLETWAPESATAPPTLDLSVFVAAQSAAAIDAGDFLLVVGPNLGALAAGRTLGRFADLLGPPGRAALTEVAQAEAAVAPGRVLAEVVYVPRNARHANVSVRPAVHAREITIAAAAGVPEENIVPVGELVVGMHEGRFAIRWPAGNASVVAVQSHMLSTALAPAAAVFLLAAARDGLCQLSSFDWGPAADFPFLPRVQRGRIVLAPAQWRVDPAELLDGGLVEWRESRWVPRHVYLAAGDNRLLLDLEDAAHAEVLRDELHGLGDGQMAVLQEALPGRSEAWLQGPGGGHMAELVVPLVLREPPTQPAEPRRTARPASRSARRRPPGSDWLYFKLYGPRLFDDEIIAGPLPAFGAFATGASLCEGWFFLRYADPQPHLRVRFHGDPATLGGPLFQQASSWASDLIASGVRTSFSVDTYEREIERYGGEEGLRLAEAVFCADSPAAAGMLRLIRESGRHEEEEEATLLAVLGVDDLLRGLGLDTAARLQLLRAAAVLSPRDGKVYRRRKDELRQSLIDPGSPALADLLAERRAALALIGERLRALDREGRLYRPLPTICRSFVHLYVNRLLGADRDLEDLVLALLRRAHEARSARRSPQP